MAENENKEKGIFKEYWAQIITMLMMVVSGISLFVASELNDKATRNMCFVDSTTTSYMESTPKTDVVLDNLSYMNLNQNYLSDIEQVCDIINNKISQKQDLRDFLRDEEKKLTPKDLEICYLQYDNFNKRYNDGEFKFPNSVVDSLACVLMYHRVFNK
ncbi:MAG: hypothetical protein IKV67_05715 [Paludibacteraceae bacterium]|nr:hypothetical protein [Paludibacteraceae bacterium]